MHACFNSIPRSREGKIVRTELRDKIIQETNELIQNPGRKEVFFREKLFTTKQINRDLKVHIYLGLQSEI